MVEAIFIELSILVIIALVISLIFKLLKQPLILGYIVTGILVSPYFLDLIKSTEDIEPFAKMGVAVLLFMVGLNLNPKVIKEVGKVSLITGIGQIIFTFIVVYLASTLLGFSSIVSAYIAIALGFSSTIIIMKLLSDKGDSSTLYGKISVGFLIVQDLIAILILMFVSSFSGDANIYSIALEKVGLGVALIVGIFIFSIFILKPATRFIAKSQELLLLFSISWAFALASLFDYVGFSIEIGALLAGITLSVSPYRFEIGSKMKPLRDFFLLIFFIVLGFQLQFESIGNTVLPVVVLSLIVLIGNPLIVLSIMGFMGYTKRNAFFAGLTVSQISEFSFILIALGVSVGHLPKEILSLVTLIGLITFAGSSFFITHNQKIYGVLSKYLSVFERNGRKRDEGRYRRHEEYDILMFGYNRIGYSVEKAFRKLKKDFLIIDNNPETILKLAKSRIECQYGDAEDSELLEDLPIEGVKMVISTIPEKDTNLLLIKKVLEKNHKAIIIVVSHQIEEALQLYEAGATYVLTPHFLGGTHTANLIEKFGFNKTDFIEEGAKNAYELLKRQKEGHHDILHERD